MPLRLVYLMLAMAVALSLVMTGCGKVAEKTTEKTIEKAIEDASGEKAEVNLKNDGSVEVKIGADTLKAGADYKWPEQLPADAPEFTYGQIVSIIENSTAESDSIFVGIDGVDDDAFDKYKSDVENAGWTINTTNRGNDEFFIIATKENRNMVASFSNRSEKGLSGGVTYAVTKQ